MSLKVKAVTTEDLTNVNTHDLLAVGQIFNKKWGDY